MVGNRALAVWPLEPRAPFLTTVPTTGPCEVPRTIAPDVRHPQTGNTLYVFALDN